MLVNAVADSDVGQAGAISERLVTDAGNAVGDRDTGYDGKEERTVSDAGHRQTVERAWDGHNVIGAPVCGYGDL